MVLVQGDTTTTWAASMAAFYNRIKIGHIEAGLRTNNKYSPFPEEINRVLTSHIADLHFAPTKWSAQNLIKEGIPKSKIFVTGNTVIDALLYARKLIKRNPKLVHLPSALKKRLKYIWVFNHSNQPLNHCNRVINIPFVLITGHRRENLGQGFRNICKAIKSLAKKFPNHCFIYPVHLNPNVRKQVMKVLKGEKNIILTDPVDYLTFVWLMDKCKLILTDSGGIQEEAPALGKPVLVMRDITERPEAIWTGTAKLVGTNSVTIVSKVKRLLTDNTACIHIVRYKNQYGDGKAAEAILSICKKL
jgi:UDP-N-acetylglucosamine 2-epimerase (non-hydrolysing)